MRCSHYFMILSNRRAHYCHCRSLSSYTVTPPEWALVISLMDSLSMATRMSVEQLLDKYLHDWLVTGRASVIGSIGTVTNEARADSELQLVQVARYFTRHHHVATLMLVRV